MLAFLASLKLAVSTILFIAIGLAVGTTLESGYDAKTAAYYVYRAWWFYTVLAVLGINIIAVAVSKLPWRKKHIPFLLAHVGIIMVLFGAWLTQRCGIDGTLRIALHERGHTVRGDKASIIVQNEARDVSWQPTEAVAIHFPGGRIDRYLPYAEAKVQFVADASKKAAIHLEVVGGFAMRAAQDVWLWEGGWRSMQLGPALFAIKKPAKKGPGLFFERHGESFSYTSINSDGKKSQGVVSGVGFLDIPWRGGVTVRVLDLLWSAHPETLYELSPDRTQTPAIHIAGGPWLGLGESYQRGDGALVAYVPQVAQLPFDVQLERFDLLFDPGTKKAAAYTSWVHIGNETKAIGMNEPLTYKGYTFYQTSYEQDEQGEVVATVLSVNRDPGRPLTYMGSFLIVIGSVLLALRQKRKRS